MRSGKSKSNLNVYVALLRGVNVGGNNMISMSSLKKSFEAMGFPHVSTYINSGNIIFTTKESDARKLEKKIEQMLSKEYQLDSKVVLRNLPEMEKLVASLPRNWTGDAGWRYYVIFLRHTIDSEKVLDELVVNDDIEEVVYRPGALLWSAQVSELTRSKMQKVSSRKIYLDMTIRNLNTTRKLCDLMKKVAETSK
ncbi:MAG TPA: DUF1697 domain-containing protein [Pyrinomonadaceae bacterium]|jgi:uncharacterized protein (DUF1697 family)|nr:DUF1697 domain-containing protein [Pyrinomonadaceae bacterium]